ncbi:hypothetical protein OUZ56_003608 [Daphnia magna]|uniref:Uncharacterized protein n=1 Tax=Daphnia magna TaxID=35525 RepID=A0ABR0A9H1_9CRUS|nr:hypothetical protein OUZ56_003608 [Daphnia magna]
MMAKKKKTSIISKKNEVSSTTTVRTETFLSKKTEAASPLLTCVDGTLDEAYLDEMKNVPFKNTCYEAKKTTKRKIWKGLKQILSQERSMECASDAVFLVLMHHHLLNLQRSIQICLDYWETTQIPTLI